MTLDIILALTEKKGTANSGKLAVRVTERPHSGAAAAIEVARRAERTLHTPQAIGAALSAIDPAQNQADLASGLSSLLGTINVLVKLGDEIAKVRIVLYYFMGLFRIANPTLDPSLRQFCVASHLGGA